MNKPNNRKLRYESLEDRRLAAGVNLQYTNLLFLQQQTSAQQTAAQQSAPVQQGSMTYGSFKSSGMVPGISLNHNETFIRSTRH